MRTYKELPCGCLVSKDGGGGLIPCCYSSQEETELHKRCMKLYFDEGKTVEQIHEILSPKEKLRKTIIKLIQLRKWVVNHYGHSAGLDSSHFLEKIDKLFPEIQDLIYDEFGNILEREISMFVMVLEKEE